MLCFKIVVSTCQNGFATELIRNLTLTETTSQMSDSECSESQVVSKNGKIKMWWREAKLVSKWFITAYFVCGWVRFFCVSNISFGWKRCRNLQISVWSRTFYFIRTFIATVSFLVFLFWIYVFPLSAKFHFMMARDKSLWNLKFLICKSDGR